MIFPGLPITPITIYLDDVVPHKYTPAFFDDSVGILKNDNTLCGAREFAFYSTDTGLPITDLITVQPNGDNVDWNFQAMSPAYTTGTISVTARITLAHVDTSVYIEKQFDVVIDALTCSS